MFSQGLKLQPKLEQKRDRGCFSMALRPALVPGPLLWERKLQPCHR